MLLEKDKMETKILNFFVDFLLLVCNIPFWNISVPSEHWQESPYKGVTPDSSNAQNSATGCQWFGWQTLDDNIVTIESNHSHGPDWCTAEQWSQHSVDLAHTCYLWWMKAEKCVRTYSSMQGESKRLMILTSEVPGLVVAVDNHWWWHRSHH